MYANTVVLYDPLLQMYCESVVPIKSLRLLFLYLKCHKKCAVSHT